MNPFDSQLKALGGIIRKRRHDLKLSQDELAFRCGLHRTYMCDVERGARNLSFSSLLAIAGGLGVTVSELTAGVQSAPGEMPAGHFTGKLEQQI